MPDGCARAMKKACTLYRILQELAKGGATLGELSERLKIPSRSVSNRLWELSEFGLVQHPYVITEDGRKAMEQLTLTPK